MGTCLVSTWATPLADEAGVGVQRALGKGCFLGARSPLTALTPHPCTQENRYVVRLSESNLVI